MGTELTTNIQESQFYAEIKELLLQARSRAYMAVNSIMSQTYWQIGKRIVEQEQNGSYRAEYGSHLIKRLAQSLAADFGDGLSVANLKNFRRFYLTYPDQEKSYTLCSLLSWSHIRLIMNVTMNGNASCRDSAKIIRKAYNRLNRNGEYAHHEPICFARRQALVGTAYILNAYQTLHKLFMWMGIDSHALLYGLDHVQQVCNKINKI